MAWWKWGAARTARIVLLLTILLTFGLLVSFEVMGRIGAGAGFIPAVLVLTGALMLFFRTLAFRVGMAFVLVFALFLLVKPRGVANMLDSINFQMQDAFFNLRGPVKPTRQVIIVDVDDDSIRELGAWPWAPQRLAALVQVPMSQGAKLVGWQEPRAGEAPLVVSLDTTMAIFQGLEPPEDSFRIDYTGVLRSYSLVTDGGDIAEGSLALRMYCLAEGYDELVPAVENQLTGLWLRSSTLRKESRFVPLDGRAGFAVTFLGPGGRWHADSDYGPKYYFPYISAANVIKHRFPPGTFQDKYVVIGSSNPDRWTPVAGPFGLPIPAVEVHALVLDNLLSGRLLVDSWHWTTLYPFVGIVLGGALLAALAAYTPASLAGLAIFLVMLLLPGVSYWALIHHHVFFDFIYPWLCLATLSAAVFVTNFFVDRRKRQKTARD